MCYLFVDTTDHLITGLMDGNFDWIEYIETTETKNSAHIHGSIYDLLQKNDLSLEEISAVFFVAGPGSYTGIRLSEGMLQILKWQGISVYSFYHFEVPVMLGVEEGCWFSTAFKGEIFVHRWKGQDVSTKLVKNENGVSLVESDEFQVPLFTHFTKDNLFKVQVEQTTDLIKNNSKDIFSKILSEQLRRPPYYFRSLEEEFRPPLNNKKV